jgi:hypothetical protein
LRELAEGLDTDAPPEQVERALARIEGVDPQDARTLAQTFARLRALKESAAMASGRLSCAT